MPGDDKTVADIELKALLQNSKDRTVLQIKHALPEEHVTYANAYVVPTCEGFPKIQISEDEENAQTKTLWSAEANVEYPLVTRFVT